MNKSIICNNCLGGQFYKIHGYEFNNPFIWCCMEFMEFIRVIENFDTIDFNNPKFELVQGKTKCYANTIIDNNINFNFIHYLYDETKDVPVKVDADILYKDILEYTKDKYFNRLSRMTNNKIFVVNTGHYLSEEHFVNSYGNQLLDKLENLSETNNIIVILDTKHVYNKPDTKLKLIYQDNIYGQSAINILQKDNHIDKELCKYIFDN